MSTSLSPGGQDGFSLVVQRLGWTQSVTPLFRIDPEFLQIVTVGPFRLCGSQDVPICMDYLQALVAMLACVRSFPGRQSSAIFMLWTYQLYPNAKQMSRSSLEFLNTYVNNTG